MVKGVLGREAAEMMRRYCCGQMVDNADVGED